MSETFQEYLKRTVREVGEPAPGDEEGQIGPPRDVGGETFSDYLKRTVRPLDEREPEPDNRGVIAKALARGTDNLQATLWGAGAMAADALGAMGVSDWMLGKYVANTKEAALSPAEVATWKDVDGIAKGATYALEAIFENVPTMIPAMVTGGGAALLATAGRKALAAGVGAYAANWAQLSGGIYGDIAERTGKRDPLTSAVGGASAAAFETAADMIGISKFIPKAEKQALAGVIGAGIAGEVQRRMVARMGIGALKQAGVESVTEAIQTAIEEAAVSHADPTVPFWTSQTMDQITEAAIKAAFAGAAFGGVAGVVPQERADQAAETKPAIDAANEMLRKAEDLREQGAPQTAAAMEILTEEMVKDVAEPDSNVNRSETRLEESLREDLEALGGSLPDGWRLQFFEETGIGDGKFTLGGEKPDGTSFHVPDYTLGEDIVAAVERGTKDPAQNAEQSTAPDDGVRTDEFGNPVPRKGSVEAVPNQAPAPDAGLTEGETPVDQAVTEQSPEPPTVVTTRDATKLEQRVNLAKNIKRFGWNPEDHGMTQAEVDSLAITPKEEPPEKPKFQGGKVVRYTLSDGMGLMNREALDMDKLSDSEAQELTELLGLGLRQPIGVKSGDVFAFTPEGEKKHARLIKLLKKAAIKQVRRAEYETQAKPTWESDDGQLAFTPGDLYPVTSPVSQTQAELDKEGGVQNEAEEKGQESLQVAPQESPAVTAPGGVWRDNTRRYREEGYTDASLGDSQMVQVASIEPSDEHGYAPDAMVAALKGGKVLPPVILERYPDGTLHIVDGSSRVNAAIKAGVKEIHARMVVYADQPSTAPETPASAPAAEAVVESANPYDTTVTGQRLTELRANKPRPVDKLYGKTGGTPEQRAGQQAKIRKWNNEYRRAQKAHKEMVEKSNAWLASQQPAPAAPVAAPAVAEVPTQQPDPIEAALTKAIEATNQRGEVNDFVKGISYASANAILRIARALYRGGKTIVQAVKEAIAQWRRDNPEAQFDEAELEGKLGQMLEVEAAGQPEPAAPAEPPTPPPPPAPPGTGSTGEPLSDRPFQTPIGRKDQTFLTTAIEWLNDPQVPVRRTGNDERITAMTRIVESFGDDHVAALQYLAAPPAEHKITPDLQAIGTIIVADRAKGAEYAATDPREKQRLGEIALQAVVQSKLAGNAMGAALQAFTNAKKILGEGFYAAEYERFIREHQRTALTDDGAGRLADWIKGNLKRTGAQVLEWLAEIDPRLAAAVANATPTPAWTPDVEKRVNALLAKVGYRELYADKSGKRLAKLLEQLIAEPEPKAETGTVDRLYQDMVAELSRLMRQALDLKKDAQPKDIRARLLRVMGEQQSRLNVLAKIDQLVQDTKNDALIETWESMALPEMQKPASRATLRALLAEETWPDDWNAVFDSRTDGPVVEAIVDSVMAKLEARKTSGVDLSPLRPLIQAEANRIRDFHFQRWNQRVSDVSLDRKGKLASIINRLRRDGVSLSWRRIMESSDGTRAGIARQIFEQLTAEGHLSRAERLDLANELSDAFAKAWYAQRISNIQRTIDQLTATKTVKEAVKSELPELIRLANAGVLNYASARNAISKKLKLPQFSSETARRIYEAAQAAQRKPPGAQRATAIRKVLNMIPEESGVPMTEILKAAWYGGILSGIATQARNFSGSFLNLMHEFSALSLRSPKDIPRMFSALIEGLRDSAANEFPAVMRGAEPARLNLDVRTASSTAEQLAKAQQGWKRMLGNYRYVQRFMQAVDSLWYDASSEVMATFQAAQEARRNPTSEDIDARIDKALKRTKADWQRAMTQAAEEIEQGLTDLKDQKRRAIEILRQSRPLDIQESSDAFARYVTLNNDPDGFLGIVYHSMVKLRDQYPILTPVIPFLRISANVTNMLLRSSPAGLYRLVTMRPDAIYLPIIGDKLRHADRRLTMEEWQQLRARIVVSHLTMTAAVVMNAIYGDEEDPPFQITGSFDAVPRAKRHQLAEQGIKPYQIRINGVGIDYRLTPGALMLTAVGNWADRERYSTTEDPDYMTKLEASLSAGHGVIFDQSFLSGLAGFMNRPLSNESAGFVSKVSDFGARTLGGFIPTIAKEIDTWVEPTVQQSKGFKEGLQKQIPVARWHIGRPIINALGEEVERPRYPWSWLVSTQNPDPVWDALREKASEGVFLPVVSRAAKVNGKPMTDDQFLRYQRIAGKALRRRLEADLPRFRQMDKKAAKEYLEKAGAATREQARAQIR